MAQRPLTPLEARQVAAMQARENIEWFLGDGEDFLGGSSMIPRLKLEVEAIERRIREDGGEPLDRFSRAGSLLLSLDAANRRAAEYQARLHFGSCEGHPLPQTGVDDI